MELILARHAHTGFNGANRLQGDTVPLDAKGRLQAQALALRLAGGRFDAFYSSDQVRAWQTAQMINVQLDMDLQADARLRELHFGVFTGLTDAEAALLHPDAYRAWRSNPENAPPGGEADSTFRARVAHFYAEMCARYTGRRVLVVTHGGPLRALICEATGLRMGGLWHVEIANASLTAIRMIDGFALVTRLNDVGHLEVAGLA